MCVLGAGSTGAKGRKRAARRATHLTLVKKRCTINFVVLRGVVARAPEEAQVAHVEPVGGDLVDEDDGDGTRHAVQRPCGLTVRRSGAHHQIATPTKPRLFAGVAANGRRGCGARAWQVGGSG